jgi:hypothetical protein
MINKKPCQCFDRKVKEPWARSDLTCPRTQGRTHAKPSSSPVPLVFPGSSSSSSSSSASFVDTGEVDMQCDGSGVDDDVIDSVISPENNPPPLCAEESEYVAVTR